MKSIEEIEAAAKGLRAVLKTNEDGIALADESRDMQAWRANTALARIHRQRLWALDWVLGNNDEVVE